MRYTSRTRFQVKREYRSVLVAATMNFEYTEQGKGKSTGGERLDERVAVDLFLAGLGIRSSALGETRNRQMSASG